MKHDVGEKERLVPRGEGASTRGTALIESKPHAESARRSFLCGPLFPLLVAIGLFAASMSAGRVASLQDSSGRPAPAGDTALAEHQGLGVDIPTSVDYPEVESRTELCAISSKPMLGGVDVVSYRDIEEGGTPTYGVPEHTVVYNGYSFRFSDKTNKARFEKSPVYFMPAWGGFCGWGISGEDWWTKYNLGPDADPRCWIITEDGVLYVFHSETPKGYFMENIPENVAAGDRVWEYWWGAGAVPGANGTGSPLNTDCLCTPDTCIDQ